MSQKDSRISTKSCFFRWTIYNSDVCDRQVECRSRSDCNTLVCPQSGFQTDVWRAMLQNQALLSPTPANLSLNLVGSWKSIAPVHPLEPGFLVHPAGMEMMWHCVTNGKPFEEQWPQNSSLWVRHKTLSPISSTGVLQDLPTSFV